MRASFKTCIIIVIYALCSVGCTDQIAKRKYSIVIENELNEEITIKGLFINNMTPPDTLVGSYTEAPKSKRVVYSIETSSKEDFYPIIGLAAYLNLVGLLDSVSITFTNGKTLGVNRFSTFGPLNILDDYSNQTGWQPINGESVFIITQAHKDAAQ
jgi:hypothetical protein